MAATAARIIGGSDRNRSAGVSASRASPAFIPPRK